MLIIPGRPSAGGLTWWLSEQPAGPVLSPGSPGVLMQVRDLHRAIHNRPGTGPYLLVTVGLQHDTVYTLTANGVSAQARTLPHQLSKGQTFTIALGSCYYHTSNPGVAAFYQPRVFSHGEPIYLRFLCGDQLYMDLEDTFGTAAPRPGAPEPWEKLRRQWAMPGFRDFIAKSPNIMQADDHDFWNDYPHGKPWLLWTNFGNTQQLRSQMDAAFLAYQVALNVDPAVVPAALSDMQVDQIMGASRNLSISVPPLSFFVLDTRSQRTYQNEPAGAHFADPGALSRALQWLSSLSGPGVLVLSQPLVAKRGSWFSRVVPAAKTDWHLPDYPDDYGRLLEGLFAAPHDVLVLSGEIHWSRCYRMWQRDPGRTIYEVVSSPLCRMLGDKAPDLQDINQREGKVEWTGPGGKGRANWLSLLPLPVASDATYATIRLTMLDEAVASRVRATIDFWEASSLNPSQATQAQASITVTLT